MCFCCWRLSSELPDFNTMVQLEGESVISSPLSPEMLLTIDPREMNCSTEKNSKEKRTRGKSVVKKPDMQLVVGEASSVLERYYWKKSTQVWLRSFWSNPVRNANVFHWNANVISQSGGVWPSSGYHASWSGSAARGARPAKESHRRSHSSGGMWHYWIEFRTDFGGWFFQLESQTFG